MKYKGYFITTCVLVLIDVLLTMNSIIRYGLESEWNAFIRYLIPKFDWSGMIIYFAIWCLIYYNIFILSEFLEKQNKIKIKNKEDLSMVIFVINTGVYAITYMTHILLYNYK